MTTDPDPDPADEPQGWRSRERGLADGPAEVVDPIEDWPVLPADAAARFAEYLRRHTRPPL